MENEQTDSPSWFARHRFWTAVLAATGLLLLLLALLNFLPVSVDDTAVSAPAAGYAEAAARVAAVRAAEEASGVINPLCESLLLDHGQKTEEVILFFHGFTSCPEQYRELGEQLHDLGFTVYIPRLPHHGHADRDRDALLDATAEELAALATHSVDIAQGLGERVVVSGLSGGGTITAWIAQEHAGVDRAIAVAPFLGIGFIPAPLNRVVARVADDVPNIDMWWDPRTKEQNPQTAAYAYPGYPLHALAEYLRLGYATQDAARRVKPAVDSIQVINNANDSSVNNAVTNQLVKAWRGHGEAFLSTYEFEKSLGLPHDLITPTREDGNPGLVYPVIVQSVEQ